MITEMWTLYDVFDNQFNLLERYSRGIDFQHSIEDSDHGHVANKLFVSDDLGEPLVQLVHDGHRLPGVL